MIRFCKWYLAKYSDYFWDVFNQGYETRMEEEE